MHIDVDVALSVAKPADTALQIDVHAMCDAE
jgi:hypothetical protein